MLTMPLLASACALVASADVPADVLRRARHVLDLDAPGAPVIRMVTRNAISHAYESDRMYPPYLTFVDDHFSWVDPSTGVERDSMTGAFDQRTTILSDDHGVVGRFASWPSVEGTRALDPRLVVHAWSSAPGVRTEGRCLFRDYPRIVLERAGLYGPERLFVDPKTGFVTKLDRMEPQYLWGEVHVEYVYTTWLLYPSAEAFGGLLMPTTVARVVDGQNEIVRSLISVARVARDSAPPLTMPDSGRVSTVETPRFLQAAPLDTVRLGPTTFILANRGYNEIASLLHDTVYVLECHARRDSRAGRFPVDQPSLSGAAPGRGRRHRSCLAACLRRPFLGRQWRDGHLARYVARLPGLRCGSPLAMASGQTRIDAPTSADALPWRGRDTQRA